MLELRQPPSQQSWERSQPRKIMPFRVKGQFCRDFWESSLLDWSVSTHIKPSRMPVCWSNVALIYLFNTSLVEGLFGQVQQAGAGLEQLPLDQGGV